jgi:hypothetical protein
MGLMSVSISFPADSADAGAAAVEGWTLTEGCSVIVSYSETRPSLSTDAGGNIVPTPEPEPMMPPQTPEPEPEP